jgi:pyruvate carboxylase
VFETKIQILEEVVDVACNILGALDMAVLNEPKAFQKLYVHVFRLDSKEKFEVKLHLFILFTQAGSNPHLLCLFSH